MKKKIIIIGGGIGGLSCATSLAETGNFDISIYESDIIGGQASSQKSELCNTEISWRVFGAFYSNLYRIMHSLGVFNLMYENLDGHQCLNDNQIGDVYSLIIDHNITQFNKIATILFLCKDRAINEYHDITAESYYKSKNMNIILGPYSGLEPSKVTLSAFYKFALSRYDLSEYNQYLITKYPTNDSLFEPWIKYLENKGVKIYEKKALQDIITDYNGTIKQLIIDNNTYSADEIVFACSLTPLLHIFKNNKSLREKQIFNKLSRLEKGHQFYISVNLYWKKEIIKRKKCHIYTFIDGWMPIIIKRFINIDYINNNCNNDIKEVWNIGVADYLLGNYVKKFTSQASFEEIVYEIKMNLMHSEHFKNYFDFENNTWEDYFYDYEFDNRYYQQLPSTYKFSINKGIEENLLNNNESELGDNIYFSAYYVKNTVGGASMETSCEIGLKTADLICNKYTIKNPRKPIYKTRDYISLITLPFIILDCILYKLNLKPITDFIDPVILLVIYFSIIIYFFITYNFSSYKK